MSLDKVQPRGPSLVQNKEKAEAVQKPETESNPLQAKTFEKKEQATSAQLIKRLNVKTSEEILADIEANIENELNIERKEDSEAFLDSLLYKLPSRQGETNIDMLQLVKKSLGIEQTHYQTIDLTVVNEEIENIVFKSKEPDCDNDELFEFLNTIIIKYLSDENDPLILNTIISGLANNKEKGIEFENIIQESIAEIIKEKILVIAQIY